MASQCWFTHRVYDRDNLVEQLQSEGCAACAGFDLADRSSHQAGNRAESSEQNPFLPHLATDGVGKPCSNCGSLHELIETRDARRRAPVELAIREILKRCELDNATVVFDYRRHLQRAADEIVQREALGEEAHVPHAVEYGQNHGLPANSRRNIVEGSIELETLHGEEHGIIGSGDFAGRDELGMQRGVAVRARDAQPLLCRSRWPDEKGYVPPGLSKPPSQNSHRRTGSDNE
jgi:hypothetical protein